jgi:hypothetical protein
MRVYFAVCLLALSARLCAQGTPGKHTIRSQTALKTFSSPDGAFQFKYPELLIHCEQRAQQSGGGSYWAQDECNGRDGVCDDAADLNHTTLVCFAYPRNKYTNTPAFQAAAFAVGVTGQVHAEKDCLAGSPNWNVDRIEKPAMIGSVLFNVFETSDAGMNQGMDATIYRTFHAGKCYQLSIAMAQDNAKVFDPPVGELTAQGMKQVNRSLERARDSFRFLK